MTLPINQTPVGFLSEFFNLKHCTIHNFLEVETSVSQTYMGKIYLPSYKAQESKLKNQTY